MALIVFFAKLSGLLRGVLLAGLYGTGLNGDIFSSAMRLPTLLFDITLGNSILSTFIPVFNKIWKDEGLPQAENFACNFLTIASVFVSIISVIGIVFAPTILHAIYPGYSQEKIALTSIILRIMFPAIIFTTLAYSIVGILQSFGEFIVPSLISLVSNVVFILYILFYKESGMTSMACMFLFSWSLQLFIQLPSLFKKRFRYSFIFNLKDTNMRTIVKLAWPIVVSSWLQPICVIINMHFASSIEGLSAALDYANAIYTTFAGIMVYAITNFIFPKLSKLIAQGDRQAFTKTTKTSVCLALYAVVPIMAIVIPLSFPIIEFVYKRGNFNASSVYITSIALMYYSFGIPAFAIGEILNKSFYALQDTKWPMLSSISGISASLICSLISFEKMRIAGLAVSSAIGITVTAAMLIIKINKISNNLFNVKFIVFLVKIISSGFVTACTSWTIYKFLPNICTQGLFSFMRLALSSILGGVVYILANHLLKVEEQQLVKQIVLSKNLTR